MQTHSVTTRTNFDITCSNRNHSLQRETSAA